MFPFTIQFLLVYFYRYIYYLVPKYKLATCKLIKVVQEVKAYRKHGFVQSQFVPSDRSGFHPLTLQEWLAVIVP